MTEDQEAMRGDAEWDGPSSAELRARASYLLDHGACSRCGHRADRHFREPILDEEHQWKLVRWGPPRGHQCDCRIRWSTTGEAFFDPTLT